MQGVPMALLRTMAMIRDEDCRVVLTISGAMTVAKQGQLICDMIDRKLVDAVVEWAGDDPVELWVTRGNDPAIALYERCGFSLTDEVQPLPSDPCKDEIRMRR